MNNKPLGVNNLAELINYQPGAVVSRMLLQKPNGSVTLFALAEGQAISEHTTPYDALVSVIDGEAEITGEILLMPANDPHALRAAKQFKMLLTMIK
ncbi:MAG: cupin domain-containing protein [Candidatus Margulisbacteria bacterium]|nr:cupin domain-containing protein [Candidatus Margulisiibacteriota bacterium]MBU1617678.1 cupin domain-containing protein [Candidatus Margulisiibacteriota bacterium]